MASSFSCLAVLPFFREQTVLPGGFLSHPTPGLLVSGVRAAFFLFTGQGVL